MPRGEIKFTEIASKEADIRSRIRAWTETLRDQHETACCKKLDMRVEAFRTAIFRVLQACNEQIGLAGGITCFEIACLREIHDPAEFGVIQAAFIQGDVASYRVPALPGRSKGSSRFKYENMYERIESV